jgi:hypothetical protein
MKRKIIYFSILLCFILISFYAESQSNKIVYNFKTDNVSNCLISVDFIDSNSGKIIKTFDVIENNPYNHLNYKDTISNNWGKKLNCFNKVYNIRSLNIDDIIPPDFRKNYSPTRVNINLKYYNIATSYSDYYLQAKDYVLLAYKFEIMDYLDILGGIKSSLIILNKYGDIIYKLNDIEVDINFPVLTANGKYFSFSYGAGDEDGSLFKHNGSRIYDVLGNKIIADFKAGITNPMIISENKIMIMADSSVKKSDDGLDRYSRCYVYDFKNKKIFSKTYSNDTLLNILQYTEQGFIFKNDSKTKYNETNLQKIDLYEKAFKKEELLW